MDIKLISIILISGLVGCFIGATLAYWWLSDLMGERYDKSNL